MIDILTIQKGIYDQQEQIDQLKQQWQRALMIRNIIIFLVFVLFVIATVFWR